MKITLETIANATRQLALENKKAADDMDTELPEEVKAFFVDDMGLDDDEVLNTEKEPEDGKKADDEPEATDKDDEPKDADGDTAADALADLKDAALDDTDKDAEIADAPDLDDEDTVLDLSAGKKADDEGKEEDEKKEDEKPEDKEDADKEDKEDKEDVDKEDKDKTQVNESERVNVFIRVTPEEAEEIDPHAGLGYEKVQDALEKEIGPVDSFDWDETNRFETDDGLVQIEFDCFDIVQNECNKAKSDAILVSEGKKCKKVKFHVYNIEWDTEDGDGHWDDDQPLDVDDEDEEHWDDDQIEDSDPPTEVDLEVEVCPGDDLDEVIGDALSDKYDFLVKGFNFDKIENAPVSEDGEGKEKHTYAAYFDTSVPADVFAEGYSITTDQGDEYAVSVLSQVTENEAGDFPLENVTKDGEDWYDEFNEILDKLMSEDRAYFADYDDSDIEWIGMKDDEDDEEEEDEEDDEEIDESALGDAFKSIGQGLKGILHSTLKGAAVLIAGLGGSFLFGLPGLLLAVCIAFGLMSAKESAKGVEVDEGLLGGVKDKLKTVLGVLKADPKKSKELNDKMLAAKKAGDKEAMKKIAGEVKALAGNGGKIPPDGGKKEEGDAVQVAESRYERNIVNAKPHGDKVTLVLRCPQCGETKEIEVTSDEYDRLVDGDGHIQDILPNLSPDDREMFLSGFCSKCWDAMFGGPEEEEDEEEVEVGEGGDCCECDVKERHGEFRRPKFKRDKWSDGPRRKPRFDDEEDDYADDYDEVDLTDDEVDAEDLDLVAERKRTPLDERIRDWAHAWVTSLDHTLTEMDDAELAKDDAGDYMDAATKMVTNAFKFLAGSEVEFDQHIVDDLVNGDVDLERAADLVAEYLGGHLERIWLSVEDEDEFADAADQLLRGLFAAIHAPKDTKAANLRRNAKLIQTYIEVGGGAGVQVAEETPDKQPEDPTDGKPEENIPPEYEVAAEDTCPDCGAQMREEPHTGNQRCPRCHHFEKGSYRPSIFEEEDGKVELSDITADDIKSIQGMDDKAKAELTKMDPEEREETLQLLGVADEGSVGEHVDFEVDDGEDDDEEFDAPAGCGRNPNKFKGSSPMRHRDHSDKFGSVKGPRDRRFKPRREVDIAAEHTKDVSTVSEVRKFLKECNTYSKSPALRRSVRKFDRLVKESPLKARAIVKSLDKRFSGKPVSEKRFCAAFIGSL